MPEAIATGLGPAAFVFVSLRGYVRFSKARYGVEFRRLQRFLWTLQITYHGETVAEIRPASRTHSTLSARIAQLERDGRVSPSRAGAAFVPLAKRRGALSRFLEDRD